MKIVRDFSGSPDQVFRARVDPTLVVQWLGPRSVGMEIESWDSTTGMEVGINEGFEKLDELLARS